MTEMFKDYDADSFAEYINMVLDLRSEMTEWGGLEPLIDTLDNSMLAVLSTEKRLQGLSAHEIVTIIHPEKLIAEFKPEFITKHYRLEEIISQYKPEEVEETISQYKLEQVIAQYDPEELMSQLDPEKMAAYLQRLKESQNEDDTSESES